MKTIANMAFAALVASGAALATTAPANAGVGISIGIGGPSYYGYNYSRPCRYYFQRDLPAPRRCYHDYYGYYGPNVYISNGFVFRNRDNYNRRWHNRDDFRHWRDHDWRDHRGHDRDHRWHHR